jgi:predicted unusual protein kinase regulating ubiquinone biosynthesis (AarF/ABC1/UbiB family)
VSTDLVARRATEAYLIQILRHGFFHAGEEKGEGFRFKI